VRWVVTALAILQCALVRGHGRAMERLTGEAIRLKAQLQENPEKLRKAYCLNIEQRECRVAVEWLENSKWQEICGDGSYIHRLPRYWKIEVRCSLAFVLAGGVRLPLTVTQIVYQ
jgi:hypothetical protein